MAAAVLVKPHGFTINFSLGVVTYTPAPCLDSPQDFGPFLVNHNYMQAYTCLSEACFLIDCAKM